MTKDSDESTQVSVIHLGLERLLFACAQANGFHKGAGVSGSVPLLYNLAMKDFLQLTANVKERVEAYEWRCGGVFF